MKKNVEDLLPASHFPSVFNTLCQLILTAALVGAIATGGLTKHPGPAASWKKTISTGLP